MAGSELVAKRKLPRKVRTMNTKIRDEIFQFEIFEPCSNRGYHVDGMIISSRNLQNYSPDEVLAELELMKSEGLIGHRSFGGEESGSRSWWSTRDGQIEKQKQLSKSRQVSSIMSRQGDFEVVDLVLALVVTPQSEMKLEKVGIYLYDCEPILIDQAVQKLLADGYISKVDYGFGDALSGTVKGVVHCNRYVRERLGLEEEQSVLSPSKVSDDPRFDQICINEDLKNNLKMRWAEAQMCQFIGASLASVILLGSILEGLLLSVLGDNECIAKAASKAPRDKTTKVVREIGDWKLKEMIDVAAEIGMVGKSASKHSHELRDSRNLVHPQKQIDENLQVDESLLSISFEVVNAVLDSLVKFKINEKTK